MSIFSVLDKFLTEIRLDKTLWVAYSGGLDSQVLLYAAAMLLAEKKQLPRLQAVHVHHGWHAQADNWAKQCLSFCKVFNITGHVVRVDTSSLPGESKEAVARAARYQALGDCLAPGDYLLTAHHQNDQAETLLLQLFRGAGIKGLSCMPKITSFAQGWHVRPFLNITRTELQAFAEQEQLTWIEDDSNQNKDFDRNYIRHEIMPGIQQRWPAVTKTLARVTIHCAEAQSLLQAMAVEDFKLIEGTAKKLSITQLKTLNEARQRNDINNWQQT
jgi:tRNA(Ile)-lysidine synthase